VDTFAVDAAVASERQKLSAAEEAAKEGADIRPQGWVSSLFVNNPDIPAFAHQAVKPVAEPIFSSQNFRDLPIHPFTVSGVLSCIAKVQSCRGSRHLSRWESLVSLNVRTSYNEIKKGKVNLSP
jgi:hypothetical protein